MLSHDHVRDRRQARATQRDCRTVAKDRAGRDRAAGRLKEITHERVPLDWATTQHNLGNAVRLLGEREDDPGLMEIAVVAYRAAVEDVTRERVPVVWAQIQNNLGIALASLGERNGDTTAYRSALEERTRDRAPLEWAMTQYNLGNALASLGKREDSTGQLRHAVEAYRSALAEFTRERTPPRWAETQRALGTVLLELGKRSGKRADVEQARTAFATVQEAYRAGGNAQYESYFKDKLAAVDQLLARIKRSLRQYLSLASKMKSLQWVDRAAIGENPARSKIAGVGEMMSRIASALAVFLVAVVVAVAGPSPASARENCAPIEFPAG